MIEYKEVEKDLSEKRNAGKLAGQNSVPFLSGGSVAHFRLPRKRNMFNESSGDIVPILFNDLFRNGQGFLVMFKAYLDRGEKGDSFDRIMSIASAIFKPKPYERFISIWDKMLKEWNAKEFHSTDFYNGADEFKRDTHLRSILFHLNYALKIRSCVISALIHFI